MGDLPIPISINWHLWPYCNYQCRFCFGQFPEISGKLSLKYALKIPTILANLGCKKLTLTGGEPTLCSYLDELLKQTKIEGMTTMLITNGSRLTQAFIEENLDFLDWVGISVDSPNEHTEKLLGRGNGSHIKNSIAVWEILKLYGINSKLNTVVTSLNVHEDLNPLVNRLNPTRWKVFQVLPIKGQNSGFVEELLISNTDFQRFVGRHSRNNPISESNEIMRGSYVMLDPLGRFFQNLSGAHVYSKSILIQDPTNALKSVGWKYSNFVERGGRYNW